jgi:hypothetical protein
LVGIEGGGAQGYWAVSQQGPARTGTAVGHADAAGLMI